MGFMDKLRNRFKMGKGRAKQNVGRATGDPYLETEGAAERVEGAGRQVGEQVKDAGSLLEIAVPGTMTTKFAVCAAASASRTSVSHGYGASLWFRPRALTASMVILPPESTVTMDACQYGASPLRRRCWRSQLARCTFCGIRCGDAAATPSSTT